MGPGPLHDILARVFDAAQAVPSMAAEHAHVHSHSHGHGHGDGALDPNAAWFAAVSVLAKEWLYRITKRVADEERSPVLLANAVHHRSDAYGSAVALVAILGSWWFPHLPLDPIGGGLRITVQRNEKALTANGTQGSSSLCSSSNKAGRCS